MFDLECLQRCCIGLHCSHTQNYLAYMHVVTVPLPLPLSSIWRYRKYEAKGMNYPKIRASGVRTLKRRDYKVVFRRRILAFTGKAFSYLYIQVEVQHILVLKSYIFIMLQVRFMFQYVLAKRLRSEGLRGGYFVTRRLACDESQRCLSKLCFVIQE